MVGRIYGSQWRAIERSILDRLADVMRFDPLGSVQVGDRACHFEDPRVRASAEAEAVDREFEQPFAVGFDLAMRAKLAGAHLGIAVEAHPRKSLELDRAGSINPLANPLG